MSSLGYMFCFPFLHYGLQMGSLLWVSFGSHVFGLCPLGLAAPSDPVYMYLEAYDCPLFFLPFLLFMEAYGSLRGRCSRIFTAHILTISFFYTFFRSPAGSVSAQPKSTWMVYDSLISFLVRSLRLPRGYVANEYGCLESFVIASWATVYITSHEYDRLGAMLFSPCNLFSNHATMNVIVLCFDLQLVGGYIIAISFASNVLSHPEYTEYTEFNTPICTAISITSTVLSYPEHTESNTHLSPQ